MIIIITNPPFIHFRIATNAILLYMYLGLNMENGPANGNIKIKN